VRGDGLRVLHVEVGGSYGGSLRALEVYLAQRAGSDQEHDVLLYYATAGSEKLERLARRVWWLRDRRRPRVTRAPVLKRLGRRALRVPALAEVEAWTALVADIPLARRMGPMLRAGAYDVVHVNNTFVYQVPTLLAARWAGIPLVAHGRNPVRGGPFARTMMRMADWVVTDSDALRRALERWNAGVPMSTCYNCVDLPRTDDGRAQAVRAGLAPPRATLVGSVGRLDEQKGYEYLVGAARRVVDQRPDVYFAVAGEGPSRPALERLVAESGLDGRFRLPGFVDDVTSFLSALDVFVSSSLWEGLPLAIVEAMLLGRPVVATDVGGSPEAVIPGRTGTLVPARDADALAEAILGSLDPPGGAALVVRHAKQRAAALADPAGNADAFDRVLLQAAGARSRRRVLAASSA